MLLDILIVAGCVFACLRGTRIGFLRQLCSTGGFFGGLMLGAWAEPHIIRHVHGTEARAIATVAIILGAALIFLTIGEYVGILLKYRALPKWLHKPDNGLGGLISLLSLLIGVWLMASVVNGSATPNLQQAVRGSRIITALDRTLPSAPDLIAKLGRLIDPNGFPDVFIGDEPVPRTPVNLPSLGEMANAVKTDRDSVVRIKGMGCGGIVSGSGFVVRPGLVATNAHVVAGIRNPYVQDLTGSHKATAIWFDPDLDLAILRVGGLPEPSLKLDSDEVGRDTPVAILGYPGGGNFSAKPGVVLEGMKAAGRDIYGGGYTIRDIYEVHADVLPGNSGGPLVGKDGQVLGIVFAESTNYKHIGYALIADHLDRTISQAADRDRVVSTGACAE